MKPIKVIIAGGRDFTDKEHMVRVLNAMLDVEFADRELEIVCGMARGADMTGYQVAVDNGLQVHQFPADWNTHGKAAGVIRNKQMGDFADHLVAFWDGQSRGTKHMIDYMRRLDKPVTVISY